MVLWGWGCRTLTSWHAAGAGSDPEAIEADVDEWNEAGSNNRVVAVTSVGFGRGWAMFRAMATELTCGGCTDGQGSRSAIADAMQGVHRSTLHIKGQKPRDTRQPFFVMPLEVQVGHTGRIACKQVTILHAGRAYHHAGASTG